MPGTATGFPSGRAGRAGRMGGFRMQVAGVARFEPRPAREVNRNGATFFTKPVRQQWVISGITRDLNSAPLPNCIVNLFTTVDNVFVASTVSDANGFYSFSVDGNSSARFAVAYLAGAPDVAGTTLRTLVPVLT